MRRVTQLRRQGLTLGQAAETIVEECLRLEQGVSKPCYDNVTLIIVSLADYLIDYERRNLLNTPPQLQLRKQSSLGHEYDVSSFKSKQIDFAVECHSLLHLSGSVDGRRISDVSGDASQVSTSGNVNPFVVNSIPSS